MTEQQTENGEWTVVDGRPFECPNDCGLLSIESSTSVYCQDCGYVRTVIDYVESDTVYCNGEPCIIRGVEREFDHDAMLGYYVNVHIDWINEPKKHTTKVELNQLQISGGLSALNDHLEKRGLVPQWWVRGNQEVPEQLDE